MYMYIYIYIYMYIYISIVRFRSQVLRFLPFLWSFGGQGPDPPCNKYHFGTQAHLAQIWPRST